MRVIGDSKVLSARRALKGDTTFDWEVDRLRDFRPANSTGMQAAESTTDMNTACGYGAALAHAPCTFPQTQLNPSRTHRDPKQINGRD
ncbi:hypothetical protein K32_14060 [Kaistia sp. 32K]|nr:hypothetical protein K32_14060 [Kaistia sp. 32K]